MKNNREIHNMRMAQVREEAMQAGAKDGRFRQRTVKSKKVYDRNKFKKFDY
jgi:hypothetical protein